MARKPEKQHEFTVEEVRFDSGKAYLLKLEGLEEPVWLPKSQCDLHVDTGVVYANDWIVRQKDELCDLLKLAPDED